MTANDPELYGRDLFGEVIKPKPSGPLSAQFQFPPFSVLDARGGEWQERKRAWLALGIKGEIGRGENLLGQAEQCEQYRQGAEGYGKTYNTSDWLRAHADDNKSRKRYGQAGNMADAAAALSKFGKNGDEGSWDKSGTSVFDPALCEVAYRWWCPDGGQVVDPFAGGSVRGIVAGKLGRRYWGCDLRQEQIAANEVQADAIPCTPRPVWVRGDALARLHDSPPADFVFSCPPYGDLEVYSDDAADLSAMMPAAFVDAYRSIIALAAARLRPDRFACFVVGDYRAPNGTMRDFVSTTIAAFRDAGMALYNEAILVTAVGSAAIRAPRQFQGGRKLVKTHQNVLVFVKGDWRKAVAACNGVADDPRQADLFK